MTRLSIIREITHELAIADVCRGSVIACMLVDALEGSMDFDEAAKFVNLSPETVKKLAQRGQIPNHKKHGTHFLRAELMEWMQTSEYGRVMKKAS